MNRSNGDRGISESPSTTSVSRATRRRASVAVTAPEEANDFDEDDRMPSKMAIVVLFLHVFLIMVSYSIIIPTSRQYAASLGASEGFSGLTVGVVGFVAALTVPVYRLLLKRSYAGCLYFQVAMMQIGGVLYSLAQLARTMWVMLVARMFMGIGGGFYPIYQYVAEHVGKNHRSNITSLTAGVGRASGLAMGPIVASILVYVDFNIGELQVNKETNAGWTVAIFCIAQGLLIFWFFPKHGSQMLQERARVRRLPEHENAGGSTPWKEKLMYYFVILNTIFLTLVMCTFVTAWEVAATKVIQTIFKWSIQYSALLVGGFLFTTAPFIYMLGKLSYRFDDRKILLVCIAINVCSSVLLFEYGKPMLISPYLVGSFFFLNSAYGFGVFSVALSSKVTSLKHVEPVQAYQNIAGLVARGIGAVIGDLLHPNYLATVYIILCLMSLLSTLLLYKRLVPVRSGV